MELPLVVRKVTHADGVRAGQAMAARAVAGREARDRKLEGLAVEDGKNPTDGADEAGTVESGPSHGAGPSEIVNRAGQDGGEDLLGGLAELDLFCGEVLALRRLDQVEVV